MKDTLKHYKLTIKAQSDFITTLIKERDKAIEESRELKAKIRRLFTNDAVMYNIIVDLENKLKGVTSETD